MPRQKILNIDHFRHWLKERQPNEIVGEHADCMNCPLAKYSGHRISSHLESELFVDYEVDLNGKIVKAGKKWPLPEWARAFIRIADYQGEKLTAERCLMILDRVVVGKPDARH